MARYKSEHKENTHAQIVDAAGRCFKKNGFSGVGVDGLAKDAGVTSGAFYGHFKSKQNAFSAAVEAGMEDLLSAVNQYSEQYGEDWWQEFASLYMGQLRTCDLSQGCPLQTLTPEIGRSDVGVKTNFETALLTVVKAATKSNKQKKINKTWVKLAMLVGGVTLARAVNDKKLSEEIAEAVKNAVS